MAFVCPSARYRTDATPTVQTCGACSAAPRCPQEFARFPSTIGGLRRAGTSLERVHGSNPRSAPEISRSAPERPALSLHPARCRDVWSACPGNGAPTLRRLGRVVNCLVGVDQERYRRLQRSRLFHLDGWPSAARKFPDLRHPHDRFDCNTYVRREVISALVREHPRTSSILPCKVQSVVFQ
jgi:hypothetical protein